MDRVRTGLVLAYLKVSPFWRPLEKTTAEKFIKRYMGLSSWRILWEPLFVGKFGTHYNVIPASWFWTRINKRSMSLGYPKGGFLRFAESVAKSVTKKGGKIYYKTTVDSVSKHSYKFILKTNGKAFEFDKIICTLPSHLFVRITKDLPYDYRKKLTDLKGLGAVNLVLSLKKQILRDGTYWLNINELDYPFLAVVEHTNFMDKRNYSGERLVYIGNYLEQNHEFFTKSAKELLSNFTPYMQKINPDFRKNWVKRAYLFKAPFAQPIVTVNYSKKVPPFKTPIEGLYLCNIQQVYPYDRGTNYAVELGEKVAGLIINS
jgi:protoporphyrinogen oxidase